MKTATIAEIPHRSAAPQPPRSPTEYPSEREQEARIRQCDHEAVVPAKRLEKLLFLNYCSRHFYLRRECGRAAPISRSGSCERTTLPGRFLGSGRRNFHRRKTSAERGLDYDCCVREPADHADLRLRRLHGDRVRRALDVRLVREDVGHEPDSGVRVRSARCRASAATACSSLGPPLAHGGDPDPARRAVRAPVRVPALRARHGLRAPRRPPAPAAVGRADAEVDARAGSSGPSSDARDPAHPNVRGHPRRLGQPPGDARHVRRPVRAGGDGARGRRRGRVGPDA